MIIESRNSINKLVSNREPKSDISENLIPTKILSNITIKKFNQKYESLDESDKRVIKILTNSTTDEKEGLMNDLTTECMSLVNDKLTKSDIEVKEKLLAVKERLLNSKFVVETFNTDIMKLVDLKNTLTD